MSWFDEPGLPAELVALKPATRPCSVELVRGLSPVLLRLARSCTSNDAAAQDAVQDTWVVVVDSLDAFAGRSSLKSWVCGICLHTARRRGVRESRTSPFSSLRQGRGPAVDADRFAGRRDAAPTGTWLVPPVRWDTQPEEHLAEAELRAAVKEAIARLPIAPARGHHRARRRRARRRRDGGRPWPERGQRAGAAAPRPQQGAGRARGVRRSGRSEPRRERRPGSATAGPRATAAGCCRGDRRSTGHHPTRPARPHPPRREDRTVTPRRSRALVCRQLVEKVSAYLDGDLSPRARAPVEDHLAACDGCAGYVAQVGRLLQITAAVPGEGPALPDELVATLTARFRARG